MEKGAEIFQKNSKGSNILHMAVKKGLFDVVRELMRIQYPIDEPKSNGVTALMIAI